MHIVARQNERSNPNHLPGRGCRPRPPVPQKSAEALPGRITAADYLPADVFHLVRVLAREAPRPRDGDRMRWRHLEGSRRLLYRRARDDDAAYVATRAYLAATRLTGRGAA